MAPRPERRGAVYRSPWRVARRPQRDTGEAKTNSGSVPWDSSRTVNSARVRSGPGTAAGQDAAPNLIRLRESARKATPAKGIWISKYWVGPISVSTAKEGNVNSAETIERAPIHEAQERQAFLETADLHVHDFGIPGAAAIATKGG